MIDVLLSILRETQVMALRHTQNKEVSEIVNRIKQSIGNRTFEIIPRDKNIEFVKRELKTDLRGAVDLIQSRLSEKDFVAILEDRNDDGNELYLFTLKLDGKYIYLKISLDFSNKAKAISFHKQNERIYVDYCKSIDDPYDLSFVKIVAKDWSIRYNNRNPETKLLKYDILPDSIIFEFENNLTNFEDLIRSCPRDKGLNVFKLKVIPIKEENKLQIFIPEGKR